MESADGACRVLVCDDTESIRRLIRINLELEGYRVCESPSAQHLVDFLHGRSEPSALPDLILLDAHMAPRDGWWAIGEIRAREPLAEIPVVLVTASLHGLDHEVVTEAGFDDVLGKPFELDELMDVVSRCTRAGRADSAPS